MEKVVVNFDGKYIVYHPKMNLKEFLLKNEKNLLKLPFIERVILYESIVYDYDRFKENLN